MQYSPAHLTQLGESYRKLRNTMRFLLGNLDGFDPTHDSVPATALDDRLDRYVYDRAEALAARAYKAYDEYEFHVVLRALADFCTIELSSLYCDVRKDRLYCDAKTAPERRATQTRALSLLARRHHRARRPSAASRPRRSGRTCRSWRAIPTRCTSC